MVECESFRSDAFFLDKAVLIDTWWNVNEYKKADLEYTGEVLIDTWWNVNQSA